MKVRTGFVSNSSSASFIIKWEINDDFSVEEAIDKVLEFADRKLVYEVVDHTIREQRGVYRTIFWTGILNDISCFGQAAMTFWTSLCAWSNSIEGYSLPDKCKILEAKIKYD